LKRFGLALVLLATGCKCASAIEAKVEQPQAPTAEEAASAVAPEAPVAPKPNWAPLPPDPREEQLAKAVAELLPENHLRRTPLGDALSRSAFAFYLESLDRGKMFLLQEHVDALSSYTDQMDDQLERGDLLLARSGAAVFVAQVAALEKVVAALLTKPFDFTVDESIETERDKRNYSKTEAERADLWRRTLKMQVLERTARMIDREQDLSEAKDLSAEAKAALEKSLAEIPKTFEEKEAKARKDLAENYAARFSRLQKVEPLEPAERFLNAVAAVYGPHTAYLAPADKENFDISISGSLEGIGAVLSEREHYIVIRELVPGGASWRDGKLEAGDLILAVAQDKAEPVDVADMRINEVVKMIRGPRGTTVTLTVKKPDGQIEVIPIVRDVVEIESTYARGALIGEAGRMQVGYVQLQKFYGNMRTRPGETPERNATDDVRKLLTELARRKAKAVILDLRGNGGGLLSAAVGISGLFISTGPIVQTRRYDGEKQVLRDRDPEIAFQGDVVVLVDRLSASASEILAAALQDYQRAVIVGPGPTHGKGTVQSVVNLNRVVSTQAPLGVLKLTIQQFYGIDGDSTQQRGVTPDVLLPDPLEHIEAGERFLDNPLPWDSIEGLKYELWPAHNWDLTKLAAESKQRVAEVERFDRLEKRAALLKQRDDDTLVPLQKTAFFERRDAFQKALEETEPDEEEQDGKAQLSVKLLNAVPVSSKDDRKGSKAARQKAWQKSIASDPWIAESLHVVGDMLGQKP
jgi:carboxyl-terminal processing protease